MSATELNILLVEDDDFVRDAIGEILRDAGFNVDAEATAHTALSKIRRKDFDLVVADIHLGGPNGLFMMDKARKFRPDLRCLFVSGRYEPVVCDPAIDEFMTKPFRSGELVGCVWKVVTGNKPNSRAAVAKPEQRSGLARLRRRRNGPRRRLGRTRGKT